MQPRDLGQYGTAYYLMERYEKASAEFDKALKRAPNRGDIHYTYAETLARMESYDPAWTHVHRAEDLRYDRIEEAFLTALSPEAAKSK